MAYKFSFSKQYNTERLFDIDTANFDYVSLDELYEHNGAEEVYPVRGIYINTKGRFDDRPVIATESEYVNIPAHLTDTCRAILADRNAISAINAGMVGFTIYPYEQKRYNKVCYSIRWVDVDIDEDFGG